MGSLMAGWDSTVSDPKSVRYKRNKSLTKEEIDAYWRENKRKEEEHIKPIYISGSPADISRDDQERTYKKEEEEPRVEFQRSSSTPLVSTNKEACMDMDKETSLQNLKKKNAWWTRSNWAFLNEPPVLEGNTKRYASQFHVAKLATPINQTPNLK